MLVILLSSGKSKTEVFLKLKLGFNVAFHIVQVSVVNLYHTKNWNMCIYIHMCRQYYFFISQQLLCFLVIIYKYGREQLLQVPADWLTPFNKIISFPSGIPGQYINCLCTFVSGQACMFGTAFVQCMFYIQDCATNNC